MLTNLHIFAVSATFIVLWGILLSNKLFPVKTKNKWLTGCSMIYILLGLLWSYIFLREYSLIWYNYILGGLIFTVLFWFVSLVFTYDIVVGNTRLKEIIYSPDTLIDKEGYIVGVYDENKYLGELEDDANTQVVLRIDNKNVKNGRKFKIVGVDNTQITAILTD